MNFLTRLKRVDWFALGVSGAIFYAVEFFGDPILHFLGFKFVYKLQDYRVFARPFLYALVGFCALILGYLLSWTKKLVSSAPNPFKSGWNENRTRLVFIFSFALGVFDKLWRFILGGYSLAHPASALFASRFYSALGFLDWFGLFAAALAINIALSERSRGSDKKFWLISGRVALVIEVLYGLASCSRFAIIAPILIWAMAEWYFRKRSYTMLIALLGIILVLFPYGNLCRNPAALHEYSSPVALWADSILSRAEQFTIFQSLSTLRAPLDRSTLGRDFIVNFGPPRFIWKSKPVISGGGNTLAHQLGFLNASDTNTAIGATLPGDWYLQFGFMGILFGMFFMGLLWRFIYEYFVRQNALEPHSIAVYALLWLRVLAGIENSIAASYAGILKMLIVLFIFAYFAREKRSDTLTA